MASVKCEASFVFHEKACRMYVVIRNEFFTLVTK